MLNICQIIILDILRVSMYQQSKSLKQKWKQPTPNIQGRSKIHFVIVHITSTGALEITWFIDPFL